MSTQAQTQTIWNIDPTHSEVGFKVKHMMISTVRGHFNEFNATIKAANDDFSDAQVSATIQVDSISTNQEDRDNHLRSADFFDAENHAEIRFNSTSFSEGKMIGDLTIKGTTKEVVMDVDYNGTVQDPYGQTKAGFEATAKISRKEFGLTWNALTEAGNVVVGDEITIAIQAQFVKS
jgi:polyisoprenoid-binding protein YceI